MVSVYRNVPNQRVCLRMHSLGLTVSLPLLLISTLKCVMTEGNNLFRKGECISPERGFLQMNSVRIWIPNVYNIQK